jgi:integrase
MPKRIVPLSQAKVVNAKPRQKPYTLFDGGGLYLLVEPTGGKLWRFRYRRPGTAKENRLSFGAYPAVGLALARLRREEARHQLATGVDPGVVREAQKDAGTTANVETFEAVAREWFEQFKIQWTEGHATTILSRLERDLFPWIGKRPIAAITAPELLTVLRRVQGRGALESAHRIRTIAGQVFRYAVATGRAERDPSADLKGALPQPTEKHFAAITDPKAAAPLLRAIDAYRGHFVTRCAFQLAPLVFLRPGELRYGEWSEVDLDGAVWNIPGERMKGGEPHVVPLSSQAVTILTELRQLTGSGRYLFPSIRHDDRPMSENTLNAALEAIGYPSDVMTVHGFRAMARTILDEVLQVKPELIEHQLAHAVRDPLGRAYNRTAHLEERQAMMQTWADYLDGLKRGADVVPLKRRA